MASPTMNDWRTFETVKNKDKAAVLYNYLCRSGYNMTDVAQVVWNDYNPHASQRVSNITRCYGFEDRNGGRYSRYDLSLADIEGFVKKYPDGCHDYRIMDEYVKKLAEGRQCTQKQAVSQTHHSVSQNNLSAMTQYNTNENKSEDETSGDADETLGFIIWGIVFAILKFALHWGWIASFVVSLIAAGVVIALMAASENK